MRIGVDIDDVLIELQKEVARLYNKKYDNKFSFKDFTSSCFWTCMDVSKKGYFDMLKGFAGMDFLIEPPLVEDSQEIVNLLSKSHNLFCVTARPKDIREITEEFLENKFPEFEEVFFSGDVFGDSDSKAEICIKKKIDIMIEDLEDVALDCASKGINVLLMDKPWNQDVSHENIIRVRNWEEILEKIKEIENDRAN